MRRYLLVRLAATVPIVLGIVLVTMLTVELLPGDPVALMLGENAAPEQVAALRRQLGLDQPLPVRYFDYVARLARGDLGRSIRQGRPVLDEIAEVWPQTIQLTLAAMALAIAIGLLVGVISAVKPYGWLDALVRLGSLFGLSMPIFWTGLVLVYIFSFVLRLTPVGGTGTPAHLVLPAVTLAAPSVALVARMTRSSLLEVLGEDYVRTARAKGLADAAVVLGHALRNAMIPVVSVIGLQFGQLLGGAILTETVFAWPGLGRLMVQAIFSRDYIMLQGAVLVFALAFVVINFLVDLSYAYLDPRVTYG